LVPLGKFEAEAMEAQVREVEETAAAQRVQLDELRKTDRDLRVRLATAKLTAATADRDLAENMVRECTLTAPADGTILRMQVSVGGPVATGGSVPPVVFAPAGPLLVRAEVDQEFLGMVAPGMRATVQDENHPEGPTWPGRVRTVAGWVAMRRSIVLDPGEMNDVRTVECVIELDSPAGGLWVGQRVRVRVARGK
ncbi:MAG: HlyD family efflux transporter periplasmic adaptor subunit, partial [Fimbriiglobus sp.]